MAVALAADGSTRTDGLDVDRRMLGAGGATTSDAGDSADRIHRNSPRPPRRITPPRTPTRSRLPLERACGVFASGRGSGAAATGEGAIGVGIGVGFAGESAVGSEGSPSTSRGTCGGFGTDTWTWPPPSAGRAVGRSLSPFWARRMTSLGERS